MDRHQHEDGRRDFTFYCDGMCDPTDYLGDRVFDPARIRVTNLVLWYRLGGVFVPERSIWD